MGQKLRVSPLQQTLFRADPAQAIKHSNPLRRYAGILIYRSTAIAIRHGNGDEPGATPADGVARSQFLERGQRNAVLFAKIGQAVFITGDGIGEGLRDRRVDAFPGQKIYCDRAPSRGARRRAERIHLRLARPFRPRDWGARKQAAPRLDAIIANNYFIAYNANRG